MSENVKTFTVIDTETQKSVTFESHANNVAELKAEIRQHGINPDGKSIQEGISRVEFRDDAAPLPTNVPYRGTITNNLVFRLTKTNKQVRSGAMARAELYNYIKANNLGEDVKKKYGRNFTQCGTADLQKFVDNHMKTAGAKKKEAPVEKSPAQVAKACDCDSINIALINLLVTKGVINILEMDSILKGETPAVEAPAKKMSYAEANDLFKGM